MNNDAMHELMRGDQVFVPLLDYFQDAMYNLPHDPFIYCIPMDIFDCYTSRNPEMIFDEEKREQIKTQLYIKPQFMPAMEMIYREFGGKMKQLGITRPVPTLEFINYFLSILDLKEVLKQAIKHAAMEKIIYLTEIGIYYAIWTRCLPAQPLTLTSLHPPKDNLQQYERIATMIGTALERVKVAILAAPEEPQEVMIFGLDEEMEIPNALFLYMTKEMGEFLGQLIGELRDIDVGVTGECFGKYMRLKVDIDVSKPLKRFLCLELEKKKELILLLRREEDRRDTMEFNFRPLMRASGPPGKNIYYGQYRYHGEGSNTRGGGVKDSIGSPNHIEDSWRLRRDVERDLQNAPSIRRSVRMGDVQMNLVTDGVFTRQIKGVGDGDRQCAKENELASIMEILMHVDSLKANKEARSTKGLHEVFINLEADNMGLSANGMLETAQDGYGFVPPLDLENRHEEELAGCKKKGKWKRWAREGDIDESGGVPGLPDTMKTLFWNARGLEGQAFHVLHSSVQEHRPTIVLLIETICDHYVMDSLCIKLGFDAKLIIDHDGNSGGLCLFWNPTFSWMDSLEKISCDVFSSMATLDDYGLNDLGFKGPSKTNRPEASQLVKERLNRCVSNME
ncbi:hypothetical protein EZV62_007871 [Acer yangbiense]|uniref:Uncharacterized protein n=1 Tax=Acer yangbiense TaxID=1000413 RepID=A0A5C7IDX5_9ROSI|nr:hypothetical protein EZV62_007871 [Acer yangbiense]